MVDITLHISGAILRDGKEVLKTIIAVAPLIYKGFRFLQKARRTKERAKAEQPAPAEQVHEEKPSPVVD